MNNLNTTQMTTAAWTLTLGAMRIASRFDGRLLSLVGAVTAAATTVGLTN